MRLRMFFLGSSLCQLSAPPLCSVGPNDPSSCHPEEESVHRFLSGGGPKASPPAARSASATASFAGNQNQNLREPRQAFGEVSDGRRSDPYNRGSQRQQEAEMSSGKTGDAIG
jgi:hypothetical protein